MNKEFIFEAWVEHAFDQIDAGLFSGDTFHSPEAIARFRGFMARWERGLIDAEDIVWDTTPEDTLPELTPKERRARGEAYCPKCYTFGREHSKTCVYREQGRLQHVTNRIV